MNRRPLACLPLLIILAVSTSRANPVPMSIVEELNRLPARMEQNPTVNEKSEFVRLLALYGVDQPYLYEAETRARFVDRYEILKPYFIQSQANGGMPQESIQRLVRVHGSQEDKDRMCEALRSWLLLPDDSLRSAHLVYATVKGADGRFVSKQDFWGERCRAAELLSDWNDRAALPMIRKLSRQAVGMESPGLNAGGAWSLVQSIRRLAHPDSALFLTVDAVGRVTNHRESREITRLRGGRCNDLEFNRGSDLDPQVATRIWSAMASAVSDKPTGWIANMYGIRIDLQSGIHAILSATEPGHVTYQDNTRIQGVAFRLRSDALHDLVEEMSGARSSR